MLDGGAEVLVTAKYLRPGRNQPVNRVDRAAARRRGPAPAEADHAALISTVAHELRSPLTSVKGFSSTLLRRWDRFTDDQKRLMLETIEADADRVTRLITELLDVSRIDSGRLQIRPLPIDVAAVYARHVERAVASGQDRDRFAIDVRAGPARGVGRPRPPRPDPVQPDRERLPPRRGCHHPGRPPATGNGQEVLESKGHRATGVDLVVSDEGKGIALDHRDLVFSRFWHGSGPGEHRTRASTSSRDSSRPTVGASTSRRPRAVVPSSG